MTSVYNAEAKRAYYLANREHIKARMRAHRAANREQLRIKDKERNKNRSKEYRARANARSRKWYLENKEKALLYNKRYRELHPEVSKKAIAKYLVGHRDLLRRRSRDYYRKHRESEIVRAIQCNKTREARKRSSLSDPAGIKEWMQKIKQLPFVRCHWCGTKVRGSDIHFDHVTALANGGPHSIENLCASCAECNHSKSCKSLENWMANGQRFFNL